MILLRMKNILNTAFFLLKKNLKFSKKVLVSNNNNELKKRTISGLILGIILLSAIIFGGKFYTIVMIVIFTCMVVEWVDLVSKIDKEEHSRAYKFRNSGIFLLLFGLVIMILIRESRYGVITTLWLFLSIWATDVGAYFGGKKFGNKKIAASISPNKTYAGALCGATCCIVVGVLFFLFFGLSSQITFYRFVIICFSFSVLAQIGDFTKSYFKRLAGVKDTGSLIPGHGGFLDRFDSLIFTSYFIYLVLLFNGGGIF